MTTTELAPEAMEQAINQDIAIAHDRATSMIVSDVETYHEAATMLLGVKALKKNIEEYFRPLKEAAHKAHKAITQREAEELAKLSPAMAHLSNTMATWNAEQERQRRIEQERLDAEARKLAEEQQIAEAILAANAGDHAEADAILAEPVQVVAPILQSAVPKVAGLAMKSTWSAEVTSLKELVLAVAQRKAPIECLEASQTFLNMQARALKGNLRYPGVVAREKKSMAGSR